MKASTASLAIRDSRPDFYGKAAPPEYVYLGRQPILERSGALNGFELLFRSGPDNLARITDDADATMQVIARLTGDMGFGAALGGYTGYVNVDRTVLMSNVVQLLPPERFVLEILETVTFDEDIFRRCNELRRAGFRLALDDVAQVSSRLIDFLPCVDIVKIDFVECPRDRLSTLFDTVRQQGKVLIAEKVETAEDHDVAMRTGFELFQGYHLAKPEVLTSRQMSPPLLHLTQMLDGEAVIAILETVPQRIPNPFV